MVLMMIYIFQGCKLPKIEVIGVARNAKLGAIIRTNNDTIYYIKNIREWPKDYYNKQIYVKGRLKIINDSLNSNPISQKINEQRIIIHPKYGLIKDSLK